MHFVLLCEENVLMIDLSYIHMNKSVFEVEDIFDFFSFIKIKSHDDGNVCLKNYLKKPTFLHYLLSIILKRIK